MALNTLYGIILKDVHFDLAKLFWIQYYMTGVLWTGSVARNHASSHSQSQDEGLLSESCELVAQGTLENELLSEKSVKISILAFLLNTQIDMSKYSFTEYVQHTLIINLSFADEQEPSILKMILTFA